MDSQADVVTAHLTKASGLVVCYQLLYLHYFHRRIELISPMSLSVCPLDCSKSCKRVWMKFFGGVECDPRTSRLDFSGDLDHKLDPVCLD